MNTRVTQRQRKMLDEIYQVVQRGDLNPRIIREAFAGFDATATDPLTREISARFQELLRDMPASGEVQEDLLALLGSLGDTLDDEEILELLKHNGRVFSGVFATNGQREN